MTKATYLAVYIYKFMIFIYIYVYIYIKQGCKSIHDDGTHISMDTNIDK
jgi:hypothetical protein